MDETDVPIVPPKFDDVPSDNAITSSIKSLTIILVVVFFLLGIYREIFFNLCLGVLVTGLLSLQMFKNIHALTRHTRFGIFEAWLLLMLTGSSFSTFSIIIESHLLKWNAASNTAQLIELYQIRKLCFGLIFICLMRSFYAGLRLVMWLETQPLINRSGIILLGTFNWFVLSFQIIILLVTLNHINAWVQSREGKPFLKALFIAAGLFLVTFLIQRSASHYRSIAQDRFLTSGQSAIGVAGRLDPPGGAENIFHVTGKMIGILLRWIRRT